MMSIGSCFSFADKLEFHNLLLSTRHSSSLASSSSSSSSPSSSRTRVLRSRVVVESRGRRTRGNNVHVALNWECCTCIGLRELAWKEGNRRFVVAASSSKKSSSRKEEDEEGGGDGIMDEALRATIEKSKKLLEMQDDLLKQIEERKELVSSIKKNILNPKRDSSASSDFNISFTSLNISESDDSAEEKYRSEFSAENYEEPSHTPDMASGRSDNFSGEGLEQYISTQPNPIQQELSELWNYSTSEYSADKILQKQSFSERNDSGEPLVERSEPVKHANMLTQEPASVFTISDAGISNPKSSTNEVEPTRNESQMFTGDESIKASPPAGANVMNVILVAAECAPWSKTGGLGDVAGSLPKALARRGHRVMVIAPKYGDYHEAQNTGVRKRYNVAGQDIEVGYFQAYIDGVDFVFIDNNLFHHNARDIYGGDRMEIKKRMILLCKAAVEVPWHVPCGGVCYGDGNLVFIANDWHTALLPVYLKAYYRDNGLMKYARSVLVIHNVAHQGRGPVDDFLLTGLPEHYLEHFFMDDPVGGEHSNIFAAGLKCADRIVTVSHGYAWELKTQEGGWGLHNVIKENDWKLRGIVNGIDKNEWHPANDVNLQSDGYTNYSIETLKTGKRQCKEALQREMGLPVRPDTPLIGFIGRLDYQKGVDLISEAIPWMMGQDLQLCMLGTGRPDLENMLKQIEGQYRDKVRGWVGFSVKTAHRITAGADILLMPSRFEPCGLNQLYAMAYGTIPVVHAVGGLRDTVQQFNPFDESGLGWTFKRADAHHLTQALMNCLMTYRDYKDSWEGLQRRGMMQDLSWDHAAEIYEEVLVAAKYQW